jgi:hypothetical protein
VDHFHEGRHWDFEDPDETILLDDNLHQWFPKEEPRRWRNPLDLALFRYFWFLAGLPVAAAHEVSTLAQVDALHGASVLQAYFIAFSYGMIFLMLLQLFLFMTKVPSFVNRVRMDIIYILTTTRTDIAWLNNRWETKFDNLWQDIRGTLLLPMLNMQKRFYMFQVGIGLLTGIFGFITFVRTFLYTPTTLFHQARKWDRTQMFGSIIGLLALLVAFIIFFRHESSQRPTSTRRYVGRSNQSTL